MMSVVWATSNRAEVYVKDAMSTLFVYSPVLYGSGGAFDDIATVQDFYEVNPEPNPTLNHRRK